MSTYTPIATQTLSSATSSLTFSSIPQGYTDLILVIAGNNSSSTYSPYIQFNGDTSTNYSITNLYGDGSTAASTRSNSTSTAYFGSLGATQGNAIVQIQNYSNSTTYKTALIRINDAGFRVYASTILWRSTAAITSLTVFNESPGTFASGTTFSIYGIAAGATGAKAAGGIVVNSGGYVYHTFLSSGTFTPYQNLTADVLVVAGGGGGGPVYVGGGGGAGGLRLLPAQSFSASSLNTVTIGAGGAGAGSSRGGNSSIGSISATGGGSGSTNNGSTPISAFSGGSGGGGNYTDSSGYGAGNLGGYTPVEGYAGGPSTATSGFYASGGGGGAGGVGATGTNSALGSGGVGAGGTGYTNYAILNAMGTATSTGVSSGGNYYYAGGGGGASYGPGGGSTSSGGLGGGGTGSTGQGGAGTANTGGGGGGSERGGGSNGGNGGSGVVIIRYAV
jgi:hypothetical protein